MIQLRQSIKWIGLAAALFVCGAALGSMTCIWMVGRTSPQPTTDPVLLQSSISAAELDQQEPTINATASDLLKKSMKLIQEERYAAAMDIYEELKRNDHQLPNQHEFYHATCMAHTGQHEDALDKYRELVRKENTDSRLRSACLVAQADMLLHLDKIEAARILLSGLILNREPSGGTENEIRAAAYHLLALAAMRDVMPDSSELHLDDTAFARPARHVGDLALQTLIQANVNEPVEDPEPRKPFIRALSVLDYSDKDVLIDARFEAQPVTRILDRLSREIGREIHFSPTARNRLADRTQDVGVEGIDLGLFLDAVLMPFQLSWFFTEDGIQIIATDEAGHESNSAQQLATAERIGRNALVAFPEHPLAHAVVLCAGNLAFGQGSLDAAESQYRQLLRMYPRSHLEIETRFNLGKLLQLNNRYVESRESFYRVIDKAPGHPLAPMAYVHVARSYLHDGRPREAIRSLNRLSSLSPSISVNRLAGVMLVAAYLIADKPRLANEALMQFRSELSGSQFHDYAAFLAALARYRSGGSLKELEREGRGLVAALTTLGSPDFFREHDFYLIGLAYK